MRTLVIFKNKADIPANLLPVLKRQGLVADVVDCHSASDVRDCLTQPNVAPYSMVFYDGRATSVLFQKDVIAWSPVPIATCDFNTATHQGLFHLNKVIRQAYRDLSSRLQQGGKGIIKAGAFEVDLLTGHKGGAKVNEKPLQLTPTEFSILRALCIYGVSKPLLSNILFEHVYGVNTDTSINSMFVTIKNLNKKIKTADGSAYCIYSRGERGYCLKGEVNDWKTLAGGIQFSPSTGGLKCGDNAAQITPKEAKIFDCLLERKDRVVLKEFLLQAAEVPDRSNLTTHISRIRKAMFKISGCDYIETIRGKGFVLRSEPVTRVAKQCSIGQQCAPAVI